MTQYKHYSFDLWMTLIKSHPQYKKHRAEYFFKHFNTKGKSYEDVFLIIRDTEKMVDVVNQATGLNVSVLEIVSIILFQLEYDQSQLGQSDMLSIVHMMQQQFLNTYPPTLYDKDTAGVIRYLHSEGATLSILSNTAFIVGATLDVLLSNLGINKYFSFVAYSDQQGISKPNPTFFETMISMANVPKGSILHVGDNPIADIQGAEAVGLKTLQINTTSKTIKDVVS